MSSYLIATQLSGLYWIVLVQDILVRLASQAALKLERLGTYVSLNEVSFCWLCGHLGVLTAVKPLVVYRSSLTRQKSKVVLSKERLQSLMALESCRCTFSGQSSFNRLVGDEEELQAFYQAFRKRALNIWMDDGSREYLLDKNIFLSLFPQFRVCMCNVDELIPYQDSQRLLRSLFTIFDYNISPKTAKISRFITFEQFAVITSIIARGSAEERVDRM